MARQQIKLSKRHQIKEPVEIDGFEIEELKINFVNGQVSVKVRMLDDGQITETKPIIAGIKSLGLDTDQIQNAILTRFQNDGVLPSGGTITPITTEYD